MTIETDSTLGFDIFRPRYAYMKSPILCGARVFFDRNAIDYEEEVSLGSDDHSAACLPATHLTSEVHGAL